ncbi:hypothetical protein AMATHDRAFT_7130 [Amanita thiersii Skay4041]|uniref:Uncharacterized protein n=1 Tax=Amanita thiersii Skay4041 TaxID=703135 RepID=A0A2A9N954_9AGAR|nr:hypothetical protein AMATHDRAFT_7130 [Amanita thiersii Skay4041]
MSSFQMPKVFVVPPEEDHSPTWCYFDAAEQNNFGLPSVHVNSPSTITPYVQETFLSFLNSDTANDYNQYDAGSCFETHWQYYYEGDKLPYEPLPQNPRYHLADNAANDSDVIEVVKVVRCKKVIEQQSKGFEPSSGIRYSRSFRLRASKALHALQKIGRRHRGPSADLRSKALLSTSFSSAGGVEESKFRVDESDVPPRFCTPSLSGRGSVLFSQIFNSSTTSVVPVTFSSSQNHKKHNIQSERCSQANNSFTNVKQGGVNANGLKSKSYAASPSLSMKSRHRFSMMNLQKWLSSVILPSSITSSSDLTALNHCPPEVTTTPLPTSAVAANNVINTNVPYSIKDVQPAISSDLSLSCPPMSYSRKPSTLSQQLATNQFHSRGPKDSQWQPQLYHPVAGGDRGQFCHDSGSLAAELCLTLATDMDLEFGGDLDFPIESSKSQASETSSHPHGPRCFDIGGCKVIQRTRSSLSNLDCEMHLDSLHFDDLSFDVYQF